MDLNISEECLRSPAYTNITFYNNSYEIHTNWLINVAEFVQKDNLLYYIYM